MASLLHVPYLGTAEEDVLLTEWLVDEGQDFRKGDALAIVETLKAAFEVEAEDQGTLVRKLVAERTRIPVQTALGVLGALRESPSEAEIDDLLAADRAAPETEPSSEIDGAELRRVPTVSATALAAPAARRRARELDVAIDGITGTGPNGMVRVEDVEAAARSAVPVEGDGRLDPEFVAYLRSDSDAFGGLSSAFKIDLYRRAGAKIGDDVRLGPRTVLRAERLVLGNGCRFGADCSVDAVDFVAGDLVQFASRCAVRARKIELGDNAFFAADVEIGGGGAMDPEAELVVGRHGFVGEHVHLNPCRRLQLGDEVVVSRGAVLMTHSFGGSVLDGMPNRFAPVSVGDRCQIGIGAVLFPGVEMGDGSILLSGSSLVTSMPAGRLFGGVPARDLKAAARPLSPVDRAQIARDLVVEFGRQLQLRGRSVATSETDDTVDLIVTADGNEHGLRFSPTPQGDGRTLLAEEVLVSPAIDDETWDAIPAEVVAVDLTGVRIRGPSGPLADAWREFLRKRGVRLRPRTWTYPGGWL